MKLTKSQIKQLIKEELRNIMQEQDAMDPAEARQLDTSPEASSAEAHFAAAGRNLEQEMEDVWRMSEELRSRALSLYKMYWAG